METIKAQINKDGNELKFEFKAKLSFAEEMEIKNLAVEILGGWEKAAELDAAVTSAYQKHIEYNEKKLGKNVFAEKQKQLFELDEKEKTDTEGYKKLAEELNNNRFYLAYESLVRERAKAKNFAYLKSACINKPEGYKFLEDEIEMTALWLQCAEAVYIKKKQQIKKLKDMHGLSDLSSESK